VWVFLEKLIILIFLVLFFPVVYSFFPSGASYFFEDVVSPGNIYVATCSLNEDCAYGYFCVFGECVSDISKKCLNSDGCSDKEICLEGFCSELFCLEGVEPKNHKCFCAGTVCDGVCFNEKGVCCDGKWKSESITCYSGVIGFIIDLAGGIFDAIFGWLI